MLWEEDEALTVAEIAALLKVTQQTIRNWIDAGTLPHLRVGRRVRVWRSDLQALLDASPITPATSPPAPREAPAAIWDGTVPLPVIPPGR